MASAEHHCRQAENLNRLAGLTPDPEIASLLRLLAAEYLIEADDAALAADRMPARAA